MKGSGLALTSDGLAYIAVSGNADHVTIHDALLHRLPPLAKEPLDQEEELEAEAQRAASAARALEEHGAANAAVRLGIPGNDAILRYVQLPMVPAWRLKLLVDDEVSEVAEKAGEAIAADFSLLTIPDELKRPDASDLTVLIALAKEPPLEGRLAALARSGRKVHAALPTSVALFNAWVGLGQIEDGLTVLVDASASATEVALVHEGFLVFARSLAPASGLVEGDISRGANELARAVSGSIQFACGQQKLKKVPVARVRVSGPFANTSEVIESLAGALHTEAAAFDPLERVDLSQLDLEAKRRIEGRGPELVVAIGLALVGAHPRTFELDLLPMARKKQREFRSRTAFMIAAAALLGVTLLFGAVRAIWRRSQASADRKALLKVERQLMTRRSDVEALAADNQQTLRVLAALAGRTERADASLHLLDALRAVSPAKVRFTEITLENEQPAPKTPRRASRGYATPEDDQAGATREARYVLEGEVDNAGGDAAAVLSELEASLSGLPRVALAKVTGTPVARAGETLEFTLAVRIRTGAQEETP
ncbi:MAG: hypothetical protein ACYS22_09950 [Planctomycetota bacterium]